MAKTALGTPEPPRDPQARAQMRALVQRERYAKDAHAFIFEAVRTKDEHAREEAVKPFPDVPYLRALLDILLVAGKLKPPQDATYAREVGVALPHLAHWADTGVVFVEKSRQVMATWLVCAYLLWRARSHAHQLIIVQSKKEEDAAALVFNKEPHVARMSFMESTLPKPLRMLQWPLSGAYARLYFPNGSQVWGIPEGGSIIRSHTPSVISSDEAGFQPEFGAAYTAALPVVQGGGQLIAVTSAEPGEFATLVGAA